MIHSFQTEIAEECGVEAAIIFSNIQHWIKHNTANGLNVREGYVWTYNSRAAWVEQFAYMGEKQIRNAIEALVQAGLIVRGNFSGGNVNRTYWYRLAERAEAFGPKDQTKFGRKGQTITDDKPDTKQTIPLTPKGEPGGFEAFWSMYPNKVGKPKAHSAWRRLKLTEQVAVIASLPSWKDCRQWVRDGGQFIPHPTTFLNQRRWEDDPGQLMTPVESKPITDMEIPM